MSEHVRAVKSEVEAEIEQLRELLVQLCRFQERRTEAEPPTANLQAPEKPARSKGTKAAAASNGTDRYAKAMARRSARLPGLQRGSPRPEAVPKQLAVIRELKQPFRAKAFEQKLGLTKAGASSALCRFVRRGWLKRSGFGEYEMARGFPASAVAVSAPRVHVPGLDVPELSKEEQIKHALQERDYAREHGRETLAKIYQFKGYKLQGE